MTRPGWLKLDDMPGRVQPAEPGLRIAGTRDPPNLNPPELHECRSLPRGACYWSKCPRVRGKCPLTGE